MILQLDRGDEINSFWLWSPHQSISVFMFQRKGAFAYDRENWTRALTFSLSSTTFMHRWIKYCKGYSIWKITTPPPFATCKKLPPIPLWTAFRFWGLWLPRVGKNPLLVQKKLQPPTLICQAHPPPENKWSLPKHQWARGNPGFSVAWSLPA